MELDKRSFPVHGEIALGIDGRVLLIEGEGPDSIEAVLLYQREVQKYREQLSTGPWASLVCLRGQPLLPPEATSMMINTIKHAKTMNLVVTAVVFVDVEFAGYISKFWENIYQQAQVKHAFFTATREAREWLVTQVDSANSAN